eukprot:1972063-Rhodomonas_salina.1
MCIRDRKHTTGMNDEEKHTHKHTNKHTTRRQPKRRQQFPSQAPAARQRMPRQCSHHRLARVATSHADIATREHVAHLSGHSDGEGDGEVRVHGAERTGDMMDMMEMMSMIVFHVPMSAAL